MPEFLYIFGFETPRQKMNNARFGWGDENSHGMLIMAEDQDAALNWGNCVAQRYVAELYGEPEVSWAQMGYASWIENENSGPSPGWPHVQVGSYPSFIEWLAQDRA